MKLKIEMRVLTGIFAIIIAFTGFGGNTVKAAENTSAFSVTDIQRNAELVSNSKGYGVLKKTDDDQNIICALIDSNGNYIFDFDSEYADWGGYTVMDNSVVKIGTSSRSLFYDIKQNKYFDAYEWANTYVLNERDYSRTELYHCYSGNSTIVVTLHCYFMWYERELFDDVDLTFDLSGNLIMQHWGGFDSEDSSEDYWGVGDDAACHYIHKIEAAGTVVVDFITGTQSWIFVSNLDWMEDVRRGNACDKFTSFRVWAYSDGYSKVLDKDVNLYGYMDKLGDVQIEPQYEAAYGFQNGFAAVQKDGKWGYIDKANNVVIPFEYEDAYGGADGFFTVIKDGLCGIVNKDNQVVLPIEYDDISSYGNGVAYAIKDGKVFLVKPAAKAASTIALKAKTATYTGKAISIGRATVKGSTGAVTYIYYTDKACKKKTTMKNSGASKDGAAPRNVGTYYVKARVAADDNYNAKTSAAVKLTITKASPKISVKTTSKTVKVSDLADAKMTFSVGAAVDGNGTLSFAKVSNSKNAKCLAVNKTTGQISIAKGTKAGTYQLMVKITAAESANYKAGSKTVTITVKVK